MTLAPFVEVAVRSWPFRLHSPAWRLGYLSATAVESSIVLVALFLALLIAAIADDRIGASLVGGASWVLSVLFVVGSIVFGLDVLQFKGEVAGPIAAQYGVGAGWVIARMTIAIILFALLGIASLRVARTFERRSAGAPRGALAGPSQSTSRKTPTRV